MKKEIKRRVQGADNVTRRLTATDPEPPFHTIIEICDGTRWYNSEDSGWFCISKGHDSECESWIKLVGTYGPAKIIRDGRDSSE